MTETTDRAIGLPIAGYLFRVVAMQTYFFALLFAFKAFMLVKWKDDFLEVNWQTTPEVAHPFLIAWALSLLLSLMSALASHRPSDIFLQLQLMLPVFPMLVIFSDRGADLQYMIATCLMWLVCFRGSKVSGYLNF